MNPAYPQPAYMLMIGIMLYVFCILTLMASGVLNATNPPPAP